MPSIVPKLARMDYRDALKFREACLDGNNRLVDVTQHCDRTRDVQFAAAHKLTVESLLRTCGEDPLQYSPSLYRDYLSQLLTLKLLPAERLGTIVLWVQPTLRELVSCTCWQFSVSTSYICTSWMPLDSPGGVH